MKKPDWAKYKREQRKRERNRIKSLSDAALPDLREPFFEYFQRNISADLDWYDDVIGNEWFVFDDDSGIKPLTSDALSEEDLINASTSLGKAELLIGHFIDISTELARLVSDYKRAEIDARIAEVEEQDPQNVNEIMRLKKLRYQLSKQVRWAFPQWKATGD